MWARNPYEHDDLDGTDRCPHGVPWEDDQCDACERLLSDQIDREIAERRSREARDLLRVVKGER